MKTSNETAELFAALAKVGGQLKNPKKSATAKAGSYSYGYAPLDQIVEDSRATLGDQGMSCIQELLTEPGHGYVGVITRLTHASGQWLELGPFWLPSGDSAQSHGAATTYARRYALSAALSLAAEEDNDAANVKQTERRTRQARDLKSQADATVTSGEGFRVPAPSSSPDSTSGEQPIGLDGAGSEEAGGAEAGEGDRETTGTPSSASLADPEEGLWDELVERQEAMRLLLAVTDGNLNKAVTLVNRLHKTSFTKTTLDQATAEQLYAAAELGEEKANG